MINMAVFWNEYASKTEKKKKLNSNQIENGILKIELRIMHDCCFSVEAEMNLPLWSAFILGNAKIMELFVGLATRHMAHCVAHS